MGKINVIKTKIEGLYIVEPNVFYDERGYFMESYNKKDFIEQVLICALFKIMSLAQEKAF